MGDVQALRRHVRDLAALLALPAMWRGREPEQIAESLTEVLSSLLRLDVAHVQLTLAAGSSTLEAWRPAAAALPRELRDAVDAWRDPAAEGAGASGSGARPPDAAPQDGGVRFLRLAARLDRESAVLVLGCARPDFPTELEGFLCRVAVDQAMTAVHGARLLRDLQEANSAKSDFLATMSHELRTPLNAIIGYTDLLEAQVAGPLAEGQAHYLGRIKLGARHLIQLIEEILNFSRIEAGRAEVHREPVDLAELARETCGLAEPLASQKGLEVTCHAPGRLILETDAGKVRQILLNLLSNAVKFTDRGEVRLELEGDRDGVVVRVSDTGIGIPPEHRERIFEPFSQVDQGRNRRAGGTGLGLAVTRQLAQLLGGEVSVASTPGRGSEFTVRIPARAPEAAMPEPAA